MVKAKKRSVRVLGALLGVAALGTLSEAQTPPSKRLPGQPYTSPLSRQPLSSAETAALDALFAKTRPATLRIEECVRKNCGAEPDGVGSAVLMSADGLALTAYHVVYRAKNLTAVTLDKKRYSLKIIGYDDQQDIALLKVNVPRGTPYLPLAQVAPPVGEPLLAIGNGDGQFLKKKVGRLISLNAAANRADFPAGTLEMSAPLIPGDSGGPILNRAGEVVGITSYIRQGFGRGIRSYAVPVLKNDAKVADLTRGVRRDAPIIGISLSERYLDLAELPAALFAEGTKAMDLKLGTIPGAFFTGVSEGGPAARAGLRPLDPVKRTGDVVTAVSGKRVVNFSEFQYAVRSYAPGDTITLTVLRGGKPLTVKLTLVGRSTINP